MSTLDPASSATGRSIDPTVFARLCIMMFLQFFIWGAWYVTTSTYMTAAGDAMAAKIGVAYSLAPLAAIISPFFLGLVADRFFASERVLGVLHILGGVAMFFVPQAAAAGPDRFLWIVLLHALCYMPTLGLTNTIAFHNLTNQEKQFPLVRVFGTLGWIVAGLVLTFMKADKLEYGAASLARQYYLAGGCAIALGIFSFFLPHTPAPAKGKTASVGEIVGLGALRLFRSPSFVVFAIASFLICIPLAAYYAYAGRMVGDMGRAVGGTMGIGQWAEVIFMVLMPLFFARLGVKWMLAIGMLAWVLRYVLFAAGAPSSIFWMIALGIALHGICYDFFFVTGFIYTDKKASKEIRGQAQGLLVLITQGLGLGLGAILAGELFNRTVGQAKGVEALPLYPKFWWAAATFAGVVLIIFTALFKDDSKTQETDHAAAGPAGSGAPVEPVGSIEAR